MAKKRMCIVCGGNEATVPDRDNGGIGRQTNKVCRGCHSARLRGDIRHIMEAAKRRREEAAKIGLTQLIQSPLPAADIAVRLEKGD